MLPDLVCPFEGFQRRWRYVRHMVVGKEPAHVPWDLNTNLGQEPGDILEFLIGIVESRDDEGGHFDPYPYFLERADRSQHRFQVCTAILSVVFFPEGFQVHIGCIQDSMQHVQSLRCHVTIGDEVVENTRFVSQRTRIVGVLEEDRWLGVGVGDGSAAMSLRLLDYTIGGEILTDYGLSVPRHLRYVRILTEDATEVTSNRSDGEGVRSRVEVKEGFLLDGIQTAGDRFRIHQGYQAPL